MPPFRIGVISDTHGRLHPRVFDLFRGVDLILHAGDIGGDELLDRLESLAPLHAVSGNVDGPPTPRRPERIEIQTPLGRIAMTHGHRPGAPSTDLALMARSFAAFAPAIIVYGHSHIPALELVEGVRLFNPGSAGPPRFRLKPCVGMIYAGPGEDPRFDHLPLTI